MIYTALPFQTEEVDGAIRLAMPLFQVAAVRSTLRNYLLVAGFIALVLAVVITGTMAQLMSGTLRDLADNVQALASGEERGPLAPRTRGELAGLAGSLDTIADQLERNVTSLAQERNRIEAILDSMGEAVIALDSQQRITMVNREALSLLGLEGVPLGRSLIETVRSPALHALVDRSLAGEAIDDECDIGGTRPLQVHVKITPLEVNGGHVIVLHDITEIRRLMSVRRDFVANVSHELRTPLSVVRANTETLLEISNSDPEASQRFLEAVLRNAERLSSLVSDLLDISHMESGEYEPRLGMISVEQAFRRVEGIVRPGVDQKKQELSVGLSEDLQILADSQALDQILINLVENAITYSGEGARIELDAFPVDEMIRIEVRDNGPGIESHHAERVFERFYRVDEGRSREMGGTGLGLSIVKHLTDVMGGSAGYQPNDPRGSVFWVTLRSSDS